MQTFATTAPVSTVLDIPAGRIRFIAADRTDTTVEVRPANAAKSRDAKAAEEVTVDFRDGILRIEAAPAKNRLLGNSGSVEVTVQLPAGSHVQAKAALAELRGVGRLGDVTFEGAQATVKLDETAAAHLTLQAGDITIGRLAGPTTLRTHKGDIHITDAARGKAELHTQHGDITVTTTRGASATLDAHTAYGSIHNSLRNTEGPDAELNIHATTGYGDITARSN
ncbi:DUF4097 family beta strand repeat-containing protein [Streptomyces sp. NPDC059385]|uniref:DUF4097 family beta strand repeat-containing protein n=1 Tax=Streptomyces sp. NPDC059385 TaxID=3346817 RepID=UPI0036826CDB